MIYNNGHNLSDYNEKTAPKGVKDAFIKWYKFKENLKHEGQKLYIFEATRKQPTDTEGRSLMHVPQTIPFSAMDNNNGTQWHYSAFPLKKDKEGNLKYADANQSNGFLFGSIILSADRDADKIFYLSEISPLKGNTYQLEDKEALAKAKYGKISEESQLEFLMASEDSPLFKDEDYAKTVAMSYGVKNVDKIEGPYSLRQQLHIRILHLHRNKQTTGFDIQDFFENTSTKSKDVVARANIQKAIDRGFINFKSVPNAEWFLGESKNKFNQLLFRLAPSEEGKKDLVLYHWLLAHKESHDAVLRLIDVDPDEDIDLVQYTVAEVREMDDMTELRAVDKYLGVSSKQKTKDNLRTECIEELEK